LAFEHIAGQASQSLQQRQPCPHGDVVHVRHSGHSGLSSTIDFHILVMSFFIPLCLRENIMASVRCSSSEVPGVQKW
jgi:hypothetical protein